jgi:hypothetical protein
VGSADLARWRKSSFSGGTGECIELADIGAIRDSKDPDGRVIRVGLERFLASIKTGRFER